MAVRLHLPSARKDTLFTDLIHLPESNLQELVESVRHQLPSQAILRGSLQSLRLQEPPATNYKAYHGPQQLVGLQPANQGALLND